MIPRAIGRDGIPDHLSTDRTSPHHWLPLKGSRLVVYCNGERLRDVCEADRTDGYVITRHMLVLPDGSRVAVVDDDGDEVFRQYTGRVTYDLESSEDRVPIGRVVGAMKGA